MDTLTKLSIVGGFILMLLGIGKIIRDQGKADQRVTDRLDRTDKILDELTKHCKDEAVHVNAKLQEHLQLEQREWRKGVDNRLDLLLTGRTKGSKT